MGRKIPGRKHRGIRDPEKQAAIRFNSIKDKINAPPSNPNEQQIPRSLQRVIELKDKVKNGDFNKKQKKKKINEDIDGKNRVFKGKPEKPVPVFKQKPGETDRAFVHRMNKVCMDVTREAKFEEKYGVDIKRNQDGEILEVIKRPKDELEILVKKIRKEKKDKKNKKRSKKNNVEETPRLTKSQKWSLKKKQKKLKRRSQNIDDFQRYKDEVRFGETVDAPPTLVPPRKAEKFQSAPRPGKKSLLLKSIMQSESHNNNDTHPVKATLQRVNNKVIDKKGKRKGLPHALRRQLEIQQKEVINAYKELKAKKYDQKN